MKYQKEIKEYYHSLEILASQSAMFVERDTEISFRNLLNSITKKTIYNGFTRSDLEYTTESNNKIRLDTAVLTSYGIVYGIHEAKKHDIDLQQAIQEKRESNYPFFNIVFENSKQAILIQDNKEKLIVDIENKKGLSELLESFFTYTNKEISNYEKVQKTFFESVPKLVTKIREYFDIQSKKTEYQEYITNFENTLKESINKNITRFETREIIVQHILTVDIFNSVFNEISFSKYNPIAHELESITSKLINKGIHKSITNDIEDFLTIVKNTAVNIHDFSIKKEFLLNFYEKFYMTYNPKGADRLGIVYTPNSIVKFITKSTDELLKKYFNRTFIDKDVNVLDPCTGTGTFICYLLEYLFENNKKSKYKAISNKYINEIYCNELSILPYYIANLCIEKVYFEYTKEYKDFTNISYVDTLDNISYENNIYDKDKLKFDKSISEENIKRIQRQNSKRMTVVIGNPPYNANQENENQNNKNKEYKIIDNRIKETYVKESKAQNRNQNYDMYLRFIRYASDRLIDKGMISFITNNSFLDGFALDGFRETVLNEFDFIYIVDLKGDARKGTGKSVFNIQVGTAISFLIKKDNKPNKKAKIYYYPIQEDFSKDEKLKFLQSNTINSIATQFEKIKPKNRYWLNTENSDFDTFLPVLSKDKFENPIFEMSSLGVTTARDLFVYDLEKYNLEMKVKYFINTYNELLEKYSKQKISKEEAFRNINIKWSEGLKLYFNRNKKYNFSKEFIYESSYRPFVKKLNYNQSIIVERQRNFNVIFGKNLDKENICIILNKFPFRKTFSSLATKFIQEYSMLDSLDPSFCLPFYTYKNDTRQDNITNSSLQLFRKHYKSNTIQKIDIFHYIYAVFNSKNYIEKYKIQLQRQYPKIPFYDSFRELSKLGKELMNLHLNFEEIPKHKQVTIENKKEGLLLPLLKYSDTKTSIQLDTHTTINNIPIEAYHYKLGNRSPIEWVLHEHRILKPSKKQLDNYPIIFEKFNTHKNEVRRYEKTSKSYLLNLIPRLVTLSLETLKIKSEIEKYSNLS